MKITDVGDITLEIACLMRAIIFIGNIRTSPTIQKMNIETAVCTTIGKTNVTILLNVPGAFINKVYEISVQLRP